MRMLLIYSSEPSLELNDFSRTVNETSFCCKMSQSSSEGERVRVHFLLFDDISSTFTRSPGHSYPGLRCMVCDGFIDIRGKDKQYVVMCPSCNEATPMRDLPVGKAFIRCPCHCLLMCRKSSNKVVCPRAECQRTLEIMKSRPKSRSVVDPISTTINVSCAHCEHLFVVNIMKKKKIVRCPYCLKWSSIEANATEVRGKVLLITGVFLLVVITVITVTTHKATEKFPGLPAVYFALFVGSILLLIGGVFYLTMRMSPIVPPSEAKGLSVRKQGETSSTEDESSSKHSSSRDNDKSLDEDETSLTESLSI